LSACSISTVPLFVGERIGQAASRLHYLRLNEVRTAGSPLIEINAKSALLRQSFHQIGASERGRLAMRRSICLVIVAAILSATALAGDVDTGRQLAQSRCAACHAIGRWQGEVFADAPPFAVIARRFPGGETDLLVALRGPHPKMNFRPSQNEAHDIAAYIRSLAH
jgi:cytochrome c